MKKTTQFLLLATCVAGALTFASKLTAADNPAPANCMTNGMACCMGMTTTISDTDTNAVPDKMTKCPVSGDKLGGDMGEAYVFVYKGQEVKLCCKDCKKEFDKNPDKFMKLIRAADKK